MNKAEKDEALFILENQQKELRAYDQKAGYFIASNTSVYAIALFTLCIFGLIHPSNPTQSISFCSPYFWILLFLMIAYTILFTISMLRCIKVLYPRIQTEVEGITNFETGSILSKDVEKELKDYINNFDTIAFSTIASNKQILRKKHKYSKGIFGLTIAMCSILALIIIFIFVA